MKGLGVRAGVPDVVICTASGRTIFWELKAEHGVVGASQSDWLNWLDMKRFPTAVIRDIGDAARLLQSYLRETSCPTSPTASITAACTI